MNRRDIIKISAASLICSSGLVGTANAAKPVELLNVSYDPTREFYVEYNKFFADFWKSKTGQSVTIRQSHGGSGKQARAVIDGLPADVVTLALAADIDEIAKRSKRLPADWQAQLPHNSSPYVSTIVFLVKKGNPKKILNWGDLVHPGVQVITPNPKTSGGARWNYLAAYGWALKAYGNQQKAVEYLRALYKNVPVLDTGARGSTNTFVERGIGDVLIAWENEALLALKELDPGKFEIVTPSISILAEPPVAVVTKNAAKKGNGQLANIYLKMLYSEAAQNIAAKHYYRPILPKVFAKYAGQFPVVKTFKINELGGWTKVQQQHFSDGGIFDNIIKN